jgi:hypothetical protein
MNPLQRYMSEMHEVRSYGVAVKETSYYGTLEALLNEVGKTLHYSTPAATLARTVALTD